MPSLQILTLSRNKILSFQLPAKKLFHASRSHYELSPKASAVPEVWAGCLTWQQKETFKVSSLSVLKAFQWRRLFKGKAFWQETIIGGFSHRAQKIHFSVFFVSILFGPWRQMYPFTKKKTFTSCCMQDIYGIFIRQVSLPTAAEPLYGWLLWNNHLLICLPVLRGGQGQWVSSQGQQGSSHQWSPMRLQADSSWGWSHGDVQLGWNPRWSLSTDLVPIAPDLLPSLHTVSHLPQAFPNVWVFWQQRS